MFTELMNRLALGKDSSPLPTIPTTKTKNMDFYIFPPATDPAPLCSVKVKKKKKNNIWADLQQVDGLDEVVQAV